MKIPRKPNTPEKPQNARRKMDAAKRKNALLDIFPPREKMRFPSSSSQRKNLPTFRHVKDKFNSVLLFFFLPILGIHKPDDPIIISIPTNAQQWNKTTIKSNSFFQQHKFGKTGGQIPENASSFYLNSSQFNAFVCPFILFAFF